MTMQNGGGQMTVGRAFLRGLRWAAWCWLAMFAITSATYFAFGPTGGEIPAILFTGVGAIMASFIEAGNANDRSRK